MDTEGARREPVLSLWFGRRQKEQVKSCSIARTCVKSLRGQERKAFHCGSDEIAITSRLPNKGIPKLTRSSNPKREFPKGLS